MNVNAFVISKDSLLNFNQIKGRKMTADFKDRKINRVIVEGNGEGIYHILKENEKGSMGINRIICSNITIRFKDGQVNNLTFYVQPEGRIIPPHEIQDEDLRLPGFEWQEKVKPIKSDVKKDQKNASKFPVSSKQLK